MNKLKDLLYDYTDLIMSLIVILLIVFIIGTNFSYFGRNFSDLLGSSNNSDSSNSDSLSVEDEESQENTTENTSNEDDALEDAEGNREENNTVTVEIPQGASAADVGDALELNDLVSSSEDFVEATENLNVSHRLRPGTFEIPRDATLREMIQILIQSSL